MANIANESKTETVSTKVKGSVKKKLEKLAKDQEWKLSYLVSKILTQYVNK